MNITELKKQIRKHYSFLKLIKSAYIYGSVLSDRFREGKSDVDVLFICKDCNDPSNFLRKIKTLNKTIKIKMDVNVVFYGEFIKRWHIYRPPTYYIGIKLANELLWGEDLIKRVRIDEVKPIDVYKRVVDLAQGIRGVYLNGKKEDFWIEKYHGWLKISILEILFLHGKFDLNFESGFAALVKKYPSLESCGILRNKSVSIADLSMVAEKLRLHALRNIVKK